MSLNSLVQVIKFTAKTRKRQEKNSHYTVLNISDYALYSLGVYRSILPLHPKLIVQYVEFCQHAFLPLYHYTNLKDGWQQAVRISGWI